MDASPYCDLIAGKQGPVVVVQLKHALTNPSVFFFGQLFHAPEVQALPPSDPTRQLLELFSYGNYRDLAALPEPVQALVTPAMRTKLRQLTIVSVAAATRRVPYDAMLDALQLTDVRDMEDIVIDTITEGLIGARIDQAAKIIDVHEASSRDVRPSDIARLLEAFEDWGKRVDTAQAQLTSTAKSLDKNEQEYQQQRNALAVQGLMSLEIAKMELAESSARAEGYDVVDDAMVGGPRRPHSGAARRR